MTDLAHPRPDGADARLPDPAPGADDDAFRALVEVLRCLPAHPSLERLTMTGLAYDAAAAGAVALRVRGCGPEAMLVQLKHALAVGAVPLSVAGLADELSAPLVRHAIAAYYHER